MIVILTGAGISQESGIPTFRSADGLWMNEDVNAVATPDGYARDPDRVHKFYNARRRELLSVEIRPNPAHEALARLEKEYRGEVLIVTQNIDNLHERAGSINVLHMHGELLKARCEKCRSVHQWEVDLGRETACPDCAGKGCMRPHIVWFKEMPFYMDDIETAISRCRTFVSIGTSGNVYPAASFAGAARADGAMTVELNLEPTQGQHVFHTGIYGPASKVVPQWVDSVLYGEMG